MYSVSVTYALATSWGDYRRSRCLAMHSALFTEVLRRGILGNSHPRSCIEPTPTGAESRSKCLHARWPIATSCGAA
jgi:hypothetical protein